MHIKETLVDEIKRLPSFGSGAVCPDEADSKEATVRITVGDVRTIRRLKASVETQAADDVDLVNAR